MNTDHARRHIIVQYTGPNADKEVVICL